MSPSHPHAPCLCPQVRYSPDGYSLAVASRDASIRVYDCTRGYTPTARCVGHQSRVTHLDWSVDSSTLQSNCGSYEIMYWSADNGRQIRSSVDTVESDTEWATWTCILGFPVMGIWPDSSTGDDVNSVDRSRDGAFIVTGDDFGEVKLFNYPCVVDDAPNRAYKGHSSHVQKVRLCARDFHAISVGGEDRAILQWKIVSARGGKKSEAKRAASLAHDAWVPSGMGKLYGGPPGY